MRFPLTRLTDVRLRVWFIIFAVLMFARLEFRATYFPPYLAGEEAQILDAAAAIDAGVKAGIPWNVIVKANAREYNKGYAWLAYPFYKTFGYNVRITTVLVPFCVSLCCAGLFVFYQRVYPNRNILVGVIVAICLALLTVSIRRYKWHTVSYVSVLALYIFFLPYFDSAISEIGKSRSRWLGAGLFLISCFFYFGNVIYLVPAVSLVLFFEFKEGRFSKVSSALWIVPIVVLGFLMSHESVLWKDRIEVSLREVTKLATPQILSQRLDTIKELVQDYFTWPYLILIGFGLVVCVDRIRKGDRFALATLSILIWTILLQFLIEGVNNPDWLNWSMLPILVCLLAAVDRLGALMEKIGQTSFGLLIVLLLTVSGRELLFYPWLNANAHHQTHAYKFDTTAQSALVLRLIEEDRSPVNIYFLPDPSVPESDGGFKYDVNLKRADYQSVLKRVIFFSDLHALNVMLQKESPQRRGIVFLSMPEQLSSASANLEIAGQQGEIVYPFESIYQIQYSVRKFVLH